LTGQGVDAANEWANAKILFKKIDCNSIQPVTWM